MSRIILIGCGKSKASEPCAARDLYTGNLFAARLRYAEATGDAWWIVSAKYGLVTPDQLLSPYDLRITDLAPIDRAAWYLAVVGFLLDELADDTVLRAVNVELHLGEDYGEQLSGVILAAGLNLSWPARHLGLGEQLAWYRERHGLEHMRTA